MEWFFELLVNPFFSLTLLVVVVMFIVGGFIFWFIVVPKIARTITWQRFRKSFAMVLADDAGWAQIVFSKHHVPEGVVSTTRDEGDWRFLPRPRWKSSNPIPSDKDEQTQGIILKKFIWKDLGKPVWFGYVGKVALVNPATLAGLEQTDARLLDAKLKKIQDYILSLPGSARQNLLTLLGELKDSLKAKPITLVDPRKIKEVLPQMYTPSQLDAVATNRELYGMKKRGKEYGKLVIGLAAIIGLVIVAIILVSFFMK